MIFLQWVIEKIDDALNPIVVKELRQAVKGRFIIVVLLVFLALQLATIGLYISDNPSGNNFSKGKDVFVTLYTFLMLACMLAVPAYAGIRFAAERSENNMDLLFITSLTPGAIIRGKFYAAFILALLIFSTSMPFLTFTYFLRGIDMPTIFVFLLVGLLGVAITIHLAIFFACIPASQNFRLVLLPIGGAFLLGHFSIIIQISEDLLRHGFWVIFSKFNLIIEIIIAFVIFCFVIGLWHVLSIAFISPPAANKAFPVRLYLTLAWLISGGMAFFYSWYKITEWSITTWLWIFSMIFWVSFAVSTSERELIGPRVASAIPRNTSLRFPAFLFFSGAAGGMLWAFFMIALTLLASFGAYANGLIPKGSFYPFSTNLILVLGFSFYFFSYSLTAAWIRRTFLSEWFSHETNWVFALILFAMGAALSPMIAYMIMGPQFEFSYILNPFIALSEEATRLPAIVLTAFWMLIVSILSGKWFVKQFVNFRPIKEKNGHYEEEI